MTRTLFRPVGLTEMLLVLRTDRFPPRFEWQPIFYPVLVREYAEQIARDWNTKDAASGYAGYVTAFDVDAAYLEKFEEKVVGAAAVHRELWVPAEQLEEFNGHIAGPIRMERAFFGDDFRGWIPDEGPFAGMDARQQWEALQRGDPADPLAVRLHAPWFEVMWREDPAAGPLDRMVRIGVTHFGLPRTVRAVDLQTLLRLERQAAALGLNQRLPEDWLLQHASPEQAHFLSPALWHLKPGTNPHLRCELLLTTTSGQRIFNLLDVTREAFESLSETLSIEEESSVREQLNDPTTRTQRQYAERLRTDASRRDPGSERSPGPC